MILSEQCLDEQRSDEQLALCDRPGPLSASVQDVWQSPTRLSDHVRGPGNSGTHALHPTPRPSGKAGNRATLPDAMAT